MNNFENEKEFNLLKFWLEFEKINQKNHNLTLEDLLSDFEASINFENFLKKIKK